MTLESGVASCVVWRRPDQDAEAGARAAADMLEDVLAALGAGGVRAMVLDLSSAPPVAGPKTQPSLAAIARSFEDAGKRIAVVVGPSAIQRKQIGRLVASHAPEHGRVTTDLDSARDWAR